MKRKKILGIGTAFFSAIILISTATAVPASYKEAVDKLEEDSAQNVIEDLLDNDIDYLFDTLTNSDVDIESYLWTLYNNQEFRLFLRDTKTNILDKINTTFEDKEEFVKQFFNIEEAFSIVSFANRIGNTNFDPEQLAIDIQDKLEVADNEDELKADYQDEAELLMKIMWDGDGQPDPESEGLDPLINDICDEIASLYKLLISILEPSLGAFGKAVAVVTYTIILLIILFPLIIPMILVEAISDAINYEPKLIEELIRIYQQYGFTGLVVYGSLTVLAWVIAEGYLWQATCEVGRILLLIDYDVEADGDVNIVTGNSKPVAYPLSKPMDAGGAYSYEFKAVIDDHDFIDGRRRDMAQAGWDWNNNGEVDEWTPLTYDRLIKTTHIYSTSGEKFVKYRAKDQWGVIGEWTEAVGFFANRAPSTPTINGTSELKRGEEGEFTTVTSDPESNAIYYKWKIDSIPKDWEGPFESDQPVNLKKAFSNSGTHKITAKAKDVYGYESGWSNTFEVTVEKGRCKSFIYMDLLNFARFPLLEKIFQSLTQIHA